MLANEYGVLGEDRCLPPKDVLASRQKQAASFLYYNVQLSSSLLCRVFAARDSRCPAVDGRRLGASSGVHREGQKLGKGGWL